MGNPDADAGPPSVEPVAIDSVDIDPRAAGNPSRPVPQASSGDRLSTDELLARFVDLMLDSDKRVTAVPAADAWSRHIEDARAGLSLLDAEPPGSIVDVGSGNGVPGLVLAIERPARDVVLLEANGRKAQAMAGMIDALGLPNAAVVNERAETAGVEVHRDRYAVAVCRALAPPHVSVEYCLPLVATGGCLIAWLGEVDSDVLSSAATELGGQLERVQSVAGSERRNLVVVRKVALTPSRFPRRPGMAAKRPLGSGH